ncbi:MAG: ABC transporter ATP-binding protein [Propionibacteriaceae bacterium]|nr:ABC transporter ATP-binding protein [Micropruina sp.]HBX79815.1 ABC transporter [Propionibacteriaceae bacterium]HBY22282.1 ABC transporter [Propionibacteriaceae bacterium]
MAVVLEGVTKEFGVAGGEPVRALRGVSVTIAEGEVVALVGPSGSGKSTLLHVMAGLERPSSGSVVVNGVNVAALKGRPLAEYRRSIGFVFQRFNLIPMLNALDNVVAPVIPYRTTFNKPERGAELLALVGLGDRLKSPPAQLSGGQQQRVAIARALVNHPSLLLADEPTGALDSATGTEVMDLILSLRETMGMGVILATHDVGIAARCDRVVSLRDGVIVSDVASAAVSA